MDITLLIGACCTAQAVPQYVVHDAKITGGMQYGNKELRSLFLVLKAI